MPYAVVRISEHQKDKLFDTRTVRIRRQFVQVARECYGSPVLIYQSVRKPTANNRAVGCFAKAVMGVVLDVQGSDTHFDVTLSELQALSAPLSGFGQDRELINKFGRFRGWVAASDVREISKEWYLEVLGGDIQESVKFPPSDPELTPKFSEESSLIREPKFRRSVYAAYNGRCAISQITMTINGLCGLEAAHLFPVSEELRFDVAAGILLTPSWHKRFDIGALLIHDDYTWSPLTEDRETLAIADRRLFLPTPEEHWPDKSLLRRRRAKFGFR